MFSSRVVSLQIEILFYFLLLLLFEEQRCVVQITSCLMGVHTTTFEISNAEMEKEDEWTSGPLKGITRLLT